MECPRCKTEMIWNSDSDFQGSGIEIDIGDNQTTFEGIISFFSCPKCHVWLEIFQPEYNYKDK